MLNACWYGAVAFSTVVASCCATVWATRHRTVSHATDSTVRFGQCCESSHPDHLNDFLWYCCTCQNFSDSEQQLPASCIIQRGRRCSFVIPDGPAAAPVLADRKFFKNLSSSSWKRVDRADWVRRSVFLKAPNVARLPGANSAPSKALAMLMGPETLPETWVNLAA